ncbi:Predicted PurR-regulated permease PerM [Desulfonatronum thiosulfatophilum]|uniref:Predicted PurR-regulated permease PerM n=1 Tax=Desulfonatronum thiosulfatophilum TaxID=617002 RepID=A0A1G6E480_9BACT|nr:AI-2E family transporter [Desulfonatronum thiosulfatophilum]SDB52172.1 Predicted PurR-regulated permease PerM [Desulfonatronum thiosulfatophilum]
MDELRENTLKKMQQNGPEEKFRVFSETDYRIFRATAVLASVVAFIGLIIFIIWVLSFVLSLFYPLLLPLAVAGVLALVLDPVVRFFQDKLRVRRLFAVIITAILLIIILAAIWMLALPEMLTQIGELIRIGPDYLIGLYESFERTFPNLVKTISAKIEAAEIDIFGFDIEPFIGRMQRYAGILIVMLFVPLFLFFMLIDGRKFSQRATELISVLSQKQQEEVMFLTNMFIGYVTAFFQGQLVIAMIVGVMLAIGFTLVELQAAILLGLILGMLNIVPFLGVIVGLTLALPVAWVQPDGGLQLVGLTLVVFIVVQFIESWVLTPRIMSERSGLHPAIVVISLFFWGIVLGGIIGMILAVPITAFLVSAWWHIKAKYLSTVVIASEHDAIAVELKQFSD